MVRPEVVRRRLNKLDEYVAILRSLARYSFEEFDASPERYGSAERFLQLSIEVVTDLGNHIVAETEWGTVDSYGDIPELFHANRLIDDALREKWIRMIGFRNILVHDYVSIDRSIVHNVLRTGLADFGELRDVFAQFL